MATNYKYMRLAEDIKMAITNIVDSRIDDVDFFSITHIDITKDLGDVKIYFTGLNDNKDDYYVRVLTEKTGFIKRELAKKVKMRAVPNLIFKYDHSLENYNHIDALLEETKK